LIRPDINEFSTTDFSHLNESYEKGKEAAIAQKTALQALSISDKDYVIYQAKKRAKKKQWMAKLIRPTEDIIYDNKSHVDVALISSHFGLVAGKVISKKELEAAVQRVYALNRFEYVNAEFEDTESGRILTLTTREKSWGPYYLHMGIGWEGDVKGAFEATFDLGYILTDITDNGGIWKNKLTLGWESGLSSEFYQPLDKQQLFFSRTTIEYKEDNYLENRTATSDRRAEFYDKYGQMRLGVGSNYTDNGFSEIGALASLGDLSYDDVLGDFDGVQGRVLYTNYGGYLFFAYDDLNSINLPTSGNKADLKFILRNDDMNDKKLNDLVDTSLEIKFDWRGAFEIGNHSFVGLSPFSTVFTKGQITTHLSELGGFLNLSGYQKDALIGARKVFAAVVYQYDLARLSNGIGVPIYLGSSLEFGDTWELQQKIDLGDLRTSGSLFFGTDTSYGPAILGFGYAAKIENLSDDALSIFFSLGKKW
jgi:NTE family protein